MFNFNNFFGGGGGNAPPPPNPSRSNSAPSVPPASLKALSELKTISVSIDDLQEDSNKECTVCYAEHEVGSSALKLPCGHIYHHGCIKPWLEKSASCPVCRYELETNDPAYEQQRLAKMKSRKQRVRKDDLLKMSVKELRELCTSLGVSIVGCSDKNMIVENLANSKRIIVIDNVPAIDLVEEEFYALPVKDLRQMLQNFGLDSDGCVQIEDLRERLIASGRIQLVVKLPSTPSPKSGGGSDTFNSNSNKNSNSNSNSSSNSQKELHVPSISVIENMSLSDMRDFCKINFISYSGCVEASEVRSKIRDFYKAKGYLKGDSDESHRQVKSRPSDNDNDSNSDISNRKGVLAGDGNGSGNGIRTHSINVASIPTSPTVVPGSVSNSSSNNYRSSSSSNGFSSSSSFSSDGDGAFSGASSSSVSIKELREIAEAMGVDISNCIERSDIIARINSSSNGGHK